MLLQLTRTQAGTQAGTRGNTCFIGFSGLFDSVSLRPSPLLRGGTGGTAETSTFNQGDEDMITVIIMDADWNELETIEVSDTTGLVWRQGDILQPLTIYRWAVGCPGEKPMSETTYAAPNKAPENWSPNLPDGWCVSCHVRFGHTGYCPSCDRLLVKKGGYNAFDLIEDEIIDKEFVI